MVKKVIAIIMILNIILFSMNMVNAATGNVSLNSSNTSVKPGGTFTVTIAANCDSGINGIDTTYSYDTDKLELVSADVTSNNWVSLGANNAIQVICNTTSKVTSDNIYTLTFKVKDNATAGTTATVKTTDIKVDSDVSSASFTVGAKSVTINITSESTNGSNESSGSNGSSGTNGSNGSNGANGSSGTNGSSNNGSSQNPGSTENPNSAGSTSSGTTNNKSENGGASSGTSVTNKPNNSVSNGILPKTGKSDTLLTVLIILTSVCSVIFYIKTIKKNRKIEK